MSNTFFQGGETFARGRFVPCAPLVTGLATPLVAPVKCIENENPAMI